MSRSQILRQLGVMNLFFETVLILMALIAVAGSFLLDDFVISMYSNITLYLISVSLFFVTVLSVAKLFFARSHARLAKHKVQYRFKGSLGILVKFIALMIVLLYLSVSFYLGIGTMESLFGKFFIFAFFGFVWYLVVIEFKREIK